MKFLIRRTIYQLFFLLDLALGNKSEVFVLCYHSISNDWYYGVKASEFKKQINFLKKYYQFISVQDFEKYLQGKKRIYQPSVLITFDDGYQDILQIKSFLQKNNIKPIIFLISENPNKSETQTTKKILTKTQILGLKKAGWTLGSHSATHADFWTLSSNSLEKEIISSKKTLTKKFGKINYFAYPKGRYGDRVLKTIKKSGYQMAFSMNDDPINLETNKFIIPRIGINQSHGLAEFTTLFSPSVVQFRKLCKKIKLERAFT